MTQPVSPDFLAQLNAQLGAMGNPAAVSPAALPPPAPPPPPPAAQGGPTIKWLSGAAPLLDIPGQKAPSDPFGLSQPQPAAPPPAQAQPAPSGPVTPVDPSLMPPTGVDPNRIPEAKPAPPQEAPADVQFRQLGGGGVPAHEAAIRGPVQNEHLMASFDPPMEAAQRTEERSRWLAEEERNTYELEAAKAMEREEAAQKVALQRQAQMERLAMDYEDQVQRLGQMHIDSNRWWSSKSTGDKITTGILAFLGGLGALDPRGNGRNLAYEAIMRDADMDVEAQKFDAQMQQGQVEGARNTYQMALQRFQSEDAATAAARAGAIDYSLAKLGELQAQWKGVEVANAADDLRARLMMERERTIAAGIQFVPAQAAPGRYVMMVRGQMAPGTFSEKEAQNVFLEHQVKPSEKFDEQAFGIQGKLAEKAMDQAGKGDDKSVEGAKDIAHQMQQAGVPKMRQLTQAALQALAEDEGGKGEAAVRFILGQHGGNMVYSDKANAREQAFQAFANLNMNQLSGGAISPAEEVRLKAQLGSAADPAARRRALMSVMGALEAAEKNIKAPYVGTGAAERYDRGAGGKPAGLPKSWEFKGR